MYKKVVIADDEPITRMDLSELLREAGYTVVGEASDGFDAVELCRKLKPDLVLMDVKMPLLDGLKATKVIVHENLANSVVLLTAYSGREFIEQAKEVGVMGYVVKPIDEKSLMPAIEVAISKGREIEKMKNDIQEVKEQLETRKLVEKAKGILMNKHDLSESEAYNQIRKLSMDKRCPMKQIAATIVINE
ncbi:response regulator receiver and ANTAR domain protein [Geosporobacter subterraneus DSM 17957]|uniref:Stage 0 sporulation protein A homolog n=1 Tax=Geosporobacter subterraneus DSM 17957 TaxID=1121919 RepID=A0A1M6JR47_9FIRM|nr:ANTAR domain-containing response regulator [Geosporobacter subterraneus]SHJ49157.1 response regulator receiver and ANTAR domain protein [Geosporobacter subterraneus DSM 17957]